PRSNVFHHARNPMNKKILCSILVLLLGTAWSFAAPQMIAFERNQAVWIANLDGTGEKKIADGIFPAISPDGSRVAFKTVEKTSDTSYLRHIAVVDVATGKLNVFKDVPSDNSYYQLDGRRATYSFHDATTRSLGSHRYQFRWHEFPRAQ